MDIAQAFPKFLNSRYFELVSYFHVLDFAFAIGMARKTQVQRAAATAKAREAKQAKMDQRAQGKAREDAKDAAAAKKAQEAAREKAIADRKARADARMNKSRSPGPKGQKPAVVDTVVSGRVSKKWAGKTTGTASRGLFNKSNFCYRNSMLQCLIHLPEFFDYLNGVHGECEKDPKKCVVCALRTLMQTYWSSANISASPKTLKKAVQSLAQAIRASIPRQHDLYEITRNESQGDSFDFLKYLFEEIRETEQENDELKYNDLFTIRHQNQWTCSDCDNITTRTIGPAEFGHGVGISVNIQRPKKRSDERLTMLQYLRQNEYEQQLQIRCESAECIAKYGEGHEGLLRTRRTTITQAPEVLFIRLIRFAQAGMTANNQVRFSKVKGSVSFEEYLNLGEFTDSEEPLFYQLQGVVAHDGKLDSGHYIAGVRKQNGKTFCCISDDTYIGADLGGSVKELEWPGVPGNDRFDPYVLVYSKV